MSNLKGKVVAITGASSGIGEVTARLMSCLAHGGSTALRRSWPIFRPKAGRLPIARWT